MTNGFSLVIQMLMFQSRCVNHSQLVAYEMMSLLVKKQTKKLSPLAIPLATGPSLFTSNDDPALYLESNKQNKIVKWGVFILNRWPD